MSLGFIAFHESGTVLLSYGDVSLPFTLDLDKKSLETKLSRLIAMSFWKWSNSRSLVHLEICDSYISSQRVSLNGQALYVALVCRVADIEKSVVELTLIRLSASLVLFGKECLYSLLLQLSNEIQELLRAGTFSSSIEGNDVLSDIVADNDAWQHARAHFETELHKWVAAPDQYVGHAWQLLNRLDGSGAHWLQIAIFIGDEWVVVRSKFALLDLDSSTLEFDSDDLETRQLQYGSSNEGPLVCFGMKKLRFVCVAEKEALQVGVASLSPFKLQDSVASLVSEVCTELKGWTE